MDVQPFELHASDDTLRDLRERLDRTRWPDEIPGSGWDYGSNLDYVKELVEYWRSGFDWRAQERAINSFPQFRANVDGMGIHFMHERGKGPNPWPLVLTHGWPSTFAEMLKIVPLLTDPAAHGGDPADSFDVVVPSLPGYGCSDMTTERGVNLSRVSDIWTSLMAEGLGYANFGAHGGDWGVGVTIALGRDHHDHVQGIHVTNMLAAWPYTGPGSRELSQEEQDFVAAFRDWQESEGGYGHIQATKPQTLAYALNDSPVGLAAWIVEKFRSWSDCDGDVERRFTKDELLTNITIYWATQTINSSTRIYFENRARPLLFNQGERVQVPCGLALFPGENSRHGPREWAERFLNVQRWTEMPRGGHFAAAEEPELLAADLRAFFRPLRR